MFAVLAVVLTDGWKSRSAGLLDGSRGPRGL